MGMLTEKQLKEVWNKNGMKYNVRRFHQYLAERGLLPYINVNKFSNHMYELLEKFFVRGMEEEANGRQWFPAETNWSERAVERHRKSKKKSETSSGRTASENT